MEVSLKPRFLRKLKKLPDSLREEVFDKIDLFKDPRNHSSLKVHKLHGAMHGCWSFSVNYRYRIVFEWEKPNESAVLLTIGDHSIYE